MKKWIVVLFVLGSLGYLYAAVTQPQNVGLIRAYIESQTVTTLNTNAPLAVGQLVYCSNCIYSPLCVSSGTNAGAWVAVSSPTTISKCQ